MHVYMLLATTEIVVFNRSYNKLKHNHKHYSMLLSIIGKLIGMNNSPLWVLAY